MLGERAERLRVLLSVAHLVHDPSAAIAELPYEDLHVLDELEADDLALVNACLQVEHELRERGFQSLERLGALVAGDAESDAELDVRVEALPESQVLNALRCFYYLGWIYD